MRGNTHNGGSSEGRQHETPQKLTLGKSVPDEGTGARPAPHSPCPPCHQPRKWEDNGARSTKLCRGLGQRSTPSWTGHKDEGQAEASPGRRRVAGGPPRPAGTPQSRLHRHAHPDERLLTKPATGTAAWVRARLPRQGGAAGRPRTSQKAARTLALRRALLQGAPSKSRDHASQLCKEYYLHNLNTLSLMH